jgi:hypothetical protein
MQFGTLLVGVKDPLTCLLSWADSFCLIVRVFSVRLADPLLQVKTTYPRVSIAAFYIDDLLMPCDTSCRGFGRR